MNKKLYWSDYCSKSLSLYLYFFDNNCNLFAFLLPQTLFCLFFTAHYHAFSDMLVEIFICVQKLLSDRLSFSIVLLRFSLIGFRSVHENHLNKNQHAVSLRYLYSYSIYFKLLFIIGLMSLTLKSHLKRHYHYDLIQLGL